MDYTYLTLFEKYKVEHPDQIVTRDRFIDWLVDMYSIQSATIARQADLISRQSQTIDSRAETIKEQNVRIELMRRVMDEKDNEIQRHIQTIAELQRDNAALRAGLEGNERQREIDQNHFALVEKHQADQIRKLTERAERMREALEWYADDFNYSVGACLGSDGNFDEGRIAAEVLRNDNAA